MKISCKNENQILPFCVKHADCYTKIRFWREFTTPSVYWIKFTFSKVFFFDETFFWKQNWEVCVYLQICFENKTEKFVFIYKFVLKTNRVTRHFENVMYAHLAVLKLFWQITRQKQREIKTENKQASKNQTKVKNPWLKIEILFRLQNGWN